MIIFKLLYYNGYSFLIFFDLKSLKRILLLILEICILFRNDEDCLYVLDFFGL